MIGATLFGYLFWRQMAMIGWLLVGVTALIVMIDLTETISRFSEVPGFTFARALLLVSLHLPPILEQVLPFAVLLASMITLVRLNRRYELVVARSVGVSAWGFLLPVATASLFVGIVSLFTLNPLAAAAVQWDEELQASLFQRSVSSRSERALWLRQADGRASTIISAQNALADGTLLRNPTFYRLSAQGEMVDRIDATSARLAGNEWRLSNAVQSRAGELPQVLGSARLATNILPETIAQRATAPEATSFLALFGRIASLERLGLPTAPFTMQLQSLLTRPVLFVAMTLIAGTVTLRFARFGQARSVILGGLAAAFVLYVATVLVQAFGAAGLVPAYAAAWVPVLAALFFGATVLLRTEDG